MKNFESILLAQHYTKTQGFFILNSSKQQPTEAEQVWSQCAAINPINAAAATTSSDPFAKYPTLIEETISNKNIVALDAGCGYGRVAIPLLKKYEHIRIVGVDASPVMLHYFVQLVNGDVQDSICERLLLLHANINSIPFPEKMFDYIYSCAVLLHNPYNDIPNIIQEWYRLLKPQGTLILHGSFPNVYNLEGIQNAGYLKFCDEHKANGPVRVYTKTTILKLFQGWSDVKCIPVGSTLLPRQIMSFPLPFGGVIRRLNGWVERKKEQIFPGSDFLCKYFDVIVIK